MKTHWKKVFDKDYLGACDLEDGKDLKAVIKHVEIKAVKDQNGKENACNVATFEGNIKPMILNVTNCKVIKKFTKSPYIEDWKNVAVQIYVKPDIKAFGEITEGLRIREVQPTMTKPQLLPNTKQWDNAVNALKNGKTIADIENYYSITKENRETLISQSL